MRRPLPGALAVVALALAGISIASAQTNAGDDALRIALHAELRAAVDDDLRALLADADESARVHGYRALGRIGLPAWLPRLIEATRDEAAVVRAGAAGALGQLDYTLELEAELSARDRAAEALVRLLDDRSAPVGVAAASALGRVARRLDALDEWLARAGDADERVLAAAIHARAAMRAVTVGPLAAWAASPDPSIRQAVAAALAATDDPARAPLLDRLLDDEDDEVRISALFGLGFAPARIASARTARSLRLGDWREQCAALRWIGLAWRREAEEPIDDDAYAAVLRRSLDRNGSVRRCALGALAARPERSVGVDRLLEALGEEDAAVRATAIDLLAGGEAEIAAVAVARVAARDDGGATDQERAALVRLRARAGEIDTAALQALVISARPRTALAALEQLEQSDVAAAWESARAAVRGGGVVVARAAPRVLARLAGLVERDEERAAAADELWARMRDDEDRGTREAALEALLRIAPDIVRRRLSALPEMLPATLRRRAWVLLAGDAEVGPRVRQQASEWLAGDAPPVDASRVVDGALGLVGSPADLVLSGGGRELPVQLTAGDAPIAAWRLVERLGEGALDLEVSADTDALVLRAGGGDGGDIPESRELASGSLATGTVLLRGIAPGDAVVQPGLRVVLVAGPQPAAVVVGAMVDPVRTIGRWQPGERLTLRLLGPDREGGSR